MYSRNHTIAAAIASMVLLHPTFFHPGGVLGGETKPKPKGVEHANILIPQVGQKLAAIGQPQHQQGQEQPNSADMNSSWPHDAREIESSTSKQSADGDVRDDEATSPRGKVPPVPITPDSLKSVAVAAALASTPHSGSGSPRRNPIQELNLAEGSRDPEQSSYTPTNSFSLTESQREGVTPPHCVPSSSVPGNMKTAIFAGALVQVSQPTTTTEADEKFYCDHVECSLFRSDCNEPAHKNGLEYKEPKKKALRKQDSSKIHKKKKIKKNPLKKEEPQN